MSGPARSAVAALGIDHEVVRHGPAGSAAEAALGGTFADVTDGE